MTRSDNNKIGATNRWVFVDSFDAINCLSRYGMLPGKTAAHPKTKYIVFSKEQTSLLEIVFVC